MPSNRLLATTNPKFGALLRTWRVSRRFTLLQLALEADVSARHLGFLELGRAQPSRAMVLKLGEALDMPFRDQNVLLRAAGFAAVFPETELSAPEAANVRAILEMLLRNHEPFGAVALTHRWEVVMANRPQSAFLSEVIGKAILPFEIIEEPRPSLLRLLFESDVLRERLVNWNLVARETLHRARRDALWAQDEELEAVVRHLSGTLRSPMKEGDRELSVLLPVEVRTPGGVLRFFTTLTTLGAPQDVLLQDLRVEAYHPADAETEHSVRQQFAFA